ncbi:MAG: hypothetical protein OXN97_12845 [Bryobacterales bacterium]|nr:hypothetical protein [Bryobacterales bacterium]MDE0629408.1 hypothetical protein [Bryobacterales bacterium]
MIPRYLRPCFWDVDLSRFEPRDFPQYTILRILEHGDRDAAAWLRISFSDSEITDVIRNERRLSSKSANFWALVFGIPTGQVKALRASARPGCAIWSRRIA